jgi:cytochrome c peroxidase
MDDTAGRCGLMELGSVAKSHVSGLGDAESFDPKRRTGYRLSVHRSSPQPVRAFLGAGCVLYALALIASPLGLGRGYAEAPGATGEIPGFVEHGGVWTFDDPFPRDRPRATGLQHPFPSMPGLARNPITPEKVEVGRLLFFDPVLSGDKRLSCATCHHPDLGFADGRRLGMGIGGEGFGPDRLGGKELARNTPSLWNVGFNEWQFWDGRVRTLEEQAAIPLTHADEMAAEPDTVVADLRGIPEYVERFEAAFGGGGPESVTFERVSEALSAFQRTLVSYNSKFDRYAAGDFTALNASEKNGLMLFRSLHTRCFECHTFPTFSDGSFRVIGVRGEGEPDKGRGGAMSGAADHSFRVPSLRNVALTAPYMHNGSLATLEDVVTFYSEGGGRREADPVPDIDGKVKKFDLTPQEKLDLVAFMEALTDTSLRPDAPERVPSGLPVVEVTTRESPPQELIVARHADSRGAGASPEIRLRPGASERVKVIETHEVSAARLRRAEGKRAEGSVPGATFHVRPGQSIQRAVDRAHPGDRIEIAPGVYEEAVIVEIENLTLAGIATGNARPMLDGRGRLGAGITVRRAGVRLESLAFRGYQVAGLIAENAEMPHIEDLQIEPMETQRSVPRIEAY